MSMTEEEQTREGTVLSVKQKCHLNDNVKATLCNFDREPWLRETKLNNTRTMSHKTAILVKLGHILQRKCPLVFPLMSYDCSVCLQPFI